MSNMYVVVSGTFFGVVTVLQAVRALNQWPVHVETLENTGLGLMDRYACCG